MKAVLSYNQFEKIVLDPLKFQDWNNIFKYHTDIELSMTTEEIEKLETDTNSVLFHFINATGGKLCNAFMSNITLDKNPSYILFQKDFCTHKNGSLIVNEKTLDNPFKLSYAKSLEKNKTIQFQTLKGWKFLFENKTLDSNAIVLNDCYIFDDKEHINKIGSKNVIDLLDAILPKELDIAYHILVNTSTSKNKTNTFYDSFVPDLICEIDSLRAYDIHIEFVIGGGFHKRKLYTNFLNITTDKGFKVFDKRDTSKILDNNDFTIETMFTRNEPMQGDSQYDEMKIRLKELRKLIQESLDWVNAMTYNNTRSFYYSNFEQSDKIEINNRLFNNIK